ncbi:MAG TPA: L,D-transpeptidase family protein [Gaiellaceae bacterium]|nr:L,D-transpeptidase family protein [Gaiellaceae bacterium]
MRSLALTAAVLAALATAPTGGAADLTLDGPEATTYGHQVTFTGRLNPPRHRERVGIYLGSSVVAWTLTNERGFFVARPDLHTAGDYRARAPGAVSAPHEVEIVGGRTDATPAAGTAGELDDPASVSRRLAALGYAVHELPATSFGGWLRQTVYAFQKAQGITVDGIVGPQTRAALRDPEPVRPQRRSPGTHLEVDLDRQLLLVVRDGTVVRVANASTGTSETPTPTGSYRVFRRVEGIDTSPLGKLWNPLYFFRGYAIHGSTTVPPEPASHGCVRVALWEAKRLFERIPHNHVVHVY